MSEIGAGAGSSYPSALDTNNTPEVNSPNIGKTKARAEVPNDLAAALIAVQTELGTDPAGSLTNVKTFLQTEHTTDGTHGAVTADSLEMQSGQIQGSKGADVVCANALPVLTDGNIFDVTTGVNTILTIDSLGVGTVIKLHFDIVATITHDATNLVLPDGLNITTAAGDEFEFYEYASGDWRLTTSSRQQANLTGNIVQVVNVQDGALNSGATTIPNDDTIPLITEGTEFDTLAITPTSTSNKLMIEVVWNGTVSGASRTLTVALFQDSTVNALACTTIRAAERSNTKFTYFMDAGTISETTFRVRAGGNAGTTYFNGDNSGTAIAGGVGFSSITITEIKV